MILWRKMKQFIDFKKVILTIFVIIFIAVANINCVCAETAAPTNEPTSEPTPMPNVIYSIGDFKLTAQYEDQRNVSENLAINVKKSNINTLSAQIIQSIRAQEGDKDIFVYFDLELQMNGRKVSPDTTLDIEIENSDIFEKYQKITIFSVSDNEVLKIFPESETEKVKFSTFTLGKYVAAGVLNPEASPEAESTAGATSPLQNSETAGIIPTSDPLSASKKNNSDSISAGAFVFWLLAALVIGIWVGMVIGYVLWGRYKTKKIQRGPYIIGE